MVGAVHHSLLYRINMLGTPVSFTGSSSSVPTRNVGLVPWGSAFSFCRLHHDLIHNPGSTFQHEAEVSHIHFSSPVVSSTYTLPRQFKFSGHQIKFISSSQTSFFPSYGGRLYYHPPNQTCLKLEHLPHFSFPTQKVSNPVDVSFFNISCIYSSPSPLL